VIDDTDAACQRAMGFLELGMPDDALAELDDIPPGSKGSSLVLHLRVDALFRLKQWAEAAGICMPMIEQEPGDAGWWIQAAYARRRSQSVEEAEPILRRALQHHPEHGLIHYNLACYACVQGRHEEARSLLEIAFSQDPPTFLPMAAGDPDLFAISQWIMQQAGRVTKTGTP
jgi:Flp pilus assembly protein TadD